MKLKVSVFEYLNQKVMYIQDVNYYFAIRDDFDIKLGDYELNEEEALNIVKENDVEEYEIFIKTSIRERLNKINSYDIEEIKEQSSHGQFTLCLHPSRQCNLSCKYCFRESEYLGNEQLTFEVAKDAIDFLVDIYAPCASKYVVDLSGSGEPLLQIDLVKQIVEYCKKKRNDICKNIEVMFCTNLTLLTPEIVDYLDNEPVIVLGTSIDGDKITNDNNRVYANGKGTYDDIVNSLNMFKNKKLGLAVTVTPINQNVDLIYDYLYHLPNVDCVSMKFIRSYDNTKYSYKYFDVPYLVSRYENLCNNIINELEKDNFDYLKKLLKGADYFGGLILGRLYKGLYKVYRCDAGKSRITVDSNGDIFACSVMYGNSDFKIGNIYDDINRKKQKSFEIISIESVFECMDCSIRNICGGECYVDAYLMNGNIFEPLKKNCMLKNMLNRLSMAFINVLRLKYNSAYRKFASLAYEISGYEFTNNETWVAMRYLKSKNINADFFEISRDLRNNYPQDVLNCLKKYDKNISAYFIDSSTNRDEIIFPAIALLNKLGTPKMNYVLLEKYEGDKLLYQTITNYKNEFEAITFEEFITKLSSIIIA